MQHPKWVSARMASTFQLASWITKQCTLSYIRPPYFTWKCLANKMFEDIAMAKTLRCWKTLFCFTGMANTWKSSPRAYFHILGKPTKPLNEMKINECTPTQLCEFEIILFYTILYANLFLLFGHSPYFICRAISYCWEILSKALLTSTKFKILSWNDQHITMI